MLEWLRGQAAAGLIDTEDGTSFAMSPEAVAVLAESEESIWFAAGAFSGGVAPPEVVDRLAEAFRTGVGLRYDDLGPSAAHAVERMLEPWTRLALVPVIVPALGGVRERLVAGASVIDIGCGSGVAVTTLAAAFPRSDFEGWDPSRNAYRPCPGPGGGERAGQRVVSMRGGRGPASGPHPGPDPDPGLPA